MTNENSNACYVFSQTTLELALVEWFAIENDKSKQNKESLQIAVTALPWFLKHLNQSAPIYTFSHDDLNTEMGNWKSLQQNAYPNQNKRIEETCTLLLNFFKSETVINHKMIVEAQ